MKNNIFLWLAIVVVVVTGWLLVPNIFWEYAFFLRIPLLLGVLLLALPAIAEFILPAMLKNLFVLRGIWQMAFTILGATVAGMSVIFVTAIVIDNAPTRFAVPSLITSSPSWYYGLAIALTLPIVLAITDLSEEEIGKKRWLGLFIGVVFGAIFLLAFKWIRNVLATWEILNNLLVKVFSFLLKNSPAGYINSDGNLTQAHVNAFAFFLALVVGYWIVFVLYPPGTRGKKGEAAALLYVMLLVSIATLFLGGLTFYFDRFRVSVLFFWLLLSFGMYWLFKVDHFFHLKQDSLKQKNKQPELQDFKTIIDRRLQKLEEYLKTNKQEELTEEQKRTLVIVCASGGGIQAAGWTTQVLTGLQDEELLGTSFPKAISFISSVSGGSVGSMYYLDRFDSQGYPPNTELNQIFNSATADSLDAVGWGLAYPDLWRIIALPILPSALTPQISDRGIALETDWQQEMQVSNQPKTLATWRDPILDGNLPIPVFNATLVENGFRLLISPMTFGESIKQKYFDFNSLYPDDNINLVTAARLSATFPYVSPICRGNKDLKTKPNYHVADGGYFDNSGFVTTVEWLNNLLNPKDSRDPLNIKRVLLLQINPFPPASSTTQGKKNRGWLMTILGPLLTLFKVRDPILNARNLTEVELLQQRWQTEKTLEEISDRQKIDIQYFQIFFPSEKEAPEFYNEQGEYRPPLSWKLTKKEKEAIQHGWNAIKNQDQIQKIKILWRDKWNM
ncbi:MAG: hypothetical protein QNJ41_11360 [Xenococcaceae cyanobacterium MO_188.B32]|nr:hypothetical protein [Xenococcaceae cyanobacterium MO_188.B32]